MQADARWASLLSRDRQCHGLDPRDRQAAIRAAGSAPSAIAVLKTAISAATAHSSGYRLLGAGKVWAKPRRFSYLPLPPTICSSSSLSLSECIATAHHEAGIISLLLGS